MPREPVPPAKWVEENIYFDSRTGAVAGYWSHARFPYSRGVLDAFADESVNEIVLDWGTQLGKTTLLGALVCWMADCDPCAIMIGAPNIIMAHEHYKTKLEPVLESCPPLAKRLPPPHLRHMERVDLSDCWIYYAYSGGKSTLSGRSVRLLAITEINLWTDSKSREGDPVRMARDRTKAFPNRKIIIEGKPTVEGECRITQAYDQSDRRTFYVPCPHCGQYQTLELGDAGAAGGIKWDKLPDGSSDPVLARDTAYYECCHCKGRIDDRHKLGMLRRGVWARDGQSVLPSGRLTGTPKRQGRIAGFHLNSIYSTLLTFGEVAEEFVRAKHESQDALRAFVNSWLCRAWKVARRAATIEEMDAHQGDYLLGSVPENNAKLIATVDVQLDGCYYVVRAWGYGATSWLISYGYAMDWQHLETILRSPYASTDGNQHHHVSAVLIDSGYRTQEVYQWCLARAGWAIPIKGEHQYKQAGMVSVGRLSDIGIPFWRIDAGQARDQLYDHQLRVKRGDPGFWAVPRDIGKDFAKSLAAWRREEEKDDTGRVKMIWRSFDKDAEHWADCEVYQVAAASVYKFAFMARPAPEKRDTPAATTTRSPRAAAASRPDGRDYWDR